MQQWLLIKWVRFLSSRTINIIQSRVAGIDPEGAACARILLPTVTFDLQSDAKDYLYGVLESPLDADPLDATQSYYLLAQIRDAKQKFQQQCLKLEHFRDNIDQNELMQIRLFFYADRLATDILMATSVIGLVPSKLAKVQQLWKTLQDSEVHFQSAMDFVETTNELIIERSGIRYAPGLDVLLISGRDRWQECFDWAPRLGTRESGAAGGR